MVRLKTLLLEANEPQLSISIEDVQKLVSSRWVNRDAAITLGVIEDFYFDDDPKKNQYAVQYIELLNEVLAYVIKISQGLGVPYVNFNLVKNYLLENQQGFKTTIEEFFPFP